jgi:hypothetical protein
MNNLRALLLGTIVTSCDGAQSPAPAAAPAGSSQPAAPVGAAPAAASADSVPSASEQLMHEHAAFMLDRIAAKDFPGARQWFDAEMRDALPAEKLETVWSQIQTQLGAYRDRGSAQTTTAQNHPVLVYDLTMERGHVVASVVFDADGKIAGLFFRPAQ